MSRRTLVDTGPLVALCDERDALHRRAVTELDRLESHSRIVLLPCLTEAFVLLTASFERARLQQLFAQGVVEMEASLVPPKRMVDCFAFLLKFAEHAPDFADGWLLAAAAERKLSLIWTFDREFRTTWRLPDGSRPRLV